jgi:hypothetical protein
LFRELGADLETHMTKEERAPEQFLAGSANVSPRIISELTIPST